jgi:hypothetical protein
MSIMECFAWCVVCACALSICSAGILALILGCCLRKRERASSIRAAFFCGGELLAQDLLHSSPPTTYLYDHRHHASFFSSWAQDLGAAASRFFGRQPARF